jgi:hypothetical protein
MTVILPEKKVKHFLGLMDALETKFKSLLKRDLYHDAKLNVVDGELVLQVSDTLPEFIRQACQLIFERTLL